MLKARILKRVSPVSVLGLLACLAWASPGWSAPTDILVYRDKSGSEKELKGRVLNEDPEGIKFQGGSGGEVAVRASDLISLTHGDAPAEYQQAEYAEQEGDYAQASELYLKSLGAKSVGKWIQHDARYHRGDCLYHQGNLKEAAAVLTELTTEVTAKEGRFRTLAVIRLGQCRIFQGAFPEAKAALGTIVSAPGKWEDTARQLWENRLLEAQKDYKTAQPAYVRLSSSAGSYKFPDLESIAKARAAACTIALGKPEEALNALLPLLDQVSADKVEGAAVHNACGSAYLALARQEKDKDKVKQRAFSGLWEFLRVVVYSEAFPEEHAAAYAGAEQCFQLLGDPRAQQMKEERKRYYGEAFLLP